MRELHHTNDTPRRVSQHYRSKLQSAPLALPSENGRRMHAYHHFTLRSERRDAIREALAREGIASSIFYPLPLHRQPAYEPSNRGLTLPAAEAAAKSVLSLPIHPLLEEHGIDRICACVQRSAR